ncbi:hypothetical protein DERF_003159 [Dermatophagoides farinae]|uniref:Uncharacterized protein n=1 Tax=Dermatophagoides farinae TaxID=6954 RepID=A0A922LBA4_DERFA|nr:hypothetical protein DERF_003159 [Dermatophagoides farinae]
MELKCKRIAGKLSTLSRLLDEKLDIWKRLTVISFTIWPVCISVANQPWFNQVKGNERIIN